MKVLKYTILLLFTLIWIVALSPDLSRKLTAADSYRFGDLYRLSNLSKFRDPRKACLDYKTPPKVTSGKKIHLYIIGDSFTEKERVSKKDFVADTYTYAKWGEVLHVKPDTSELNILLLESVERHFREKFTNNPVQNLVADSATFVTSNFHPTFMNELDEAFSSKSTKVRLDELLFQNDFALATKEFKSDFNFKFFNRTNNEVTAVNGGENIVYYMDTDTPEQTSSFSKIRNTEIDSMVNNLNLSKKNALEIGFDVVALSIIPNKVSVLMPDYDQYNDLINQIYKHPKVDMPYINVYNDFRTLGDKAYLKGDSHWTCEGQYLWLNRVNGMLLILAVNPAL